MKLSTARSLSLVALLAALPATTALSQDKEPLKVAAISGYFSQGFGISIVEGLNRAVDELGVELKIVDTGNRALDYEEQFNNLAEDGDYDLIFVMGWELVDALTKTSDSHPDQRFIFIDGVLESENMTYIDFLEEEGSFLVGALAAELAGGKVDGFDSSTEVGFIGGRDIPVIQNFRMGMQQGIDYVDNGTELAAVFAGTFDDPAKGAELAMTLFDQGMPIVYQAAGPTGEGVLQAAAQSDGFAVGVDIDQCPSAPGHMLASMLKRADIAVYDLIEGQLAGNPVVPGTVRVGVATGGVELKICEDIADKIPASVIDAMEKVRSGIADGSIKVELGQ
ncbi:MAG: BMP family ABC transporter substrate-binding protein [Hoeflea sp.]|uniref:BMP family lipoprotein n=1 Tax=Hoeflea sp. TaxID=1940281 RepID=UPI003299A751